MNVPCSVAGMRPKSGTDASGIHTRVGESHTVPLWLRDEVAGWVAGLAQRGPRYNLVRNAG